MRATDPLWGYDLADVSRDLENLRRAKLELILRADDLIRTGKATREEVCERFDWTRATWFRRLKQARFVVLGQSGDGRSLRDLR